VVQCIIVKIPIVDEYVVLKTEDTADRLIETVIHQCHNSDLIVSQFCVIVIVSLVLPVSCVNKKAARIDKRQ
jgi:hypothetical protein